MAKQNGKSEKAQKTASNKPAASEEDDLDELEAVTAQTAVAPTLHARFDLVLRQYGAHAHQHDRGENHGESDQVEA